jgi:hypothetical protein
LFPCRTGAGLTGRRNSSLQRKVWPPSRRIDLRP